jgi:hypothetical protein
MNDTWSKFNECVQNILALAIVGAYLYMVVTGKPAPIELIGFAGGVLIFFGFKVYKNGNQSPPSS